MNAAVIAASVVVAIYGAAFFFVTVAPGVALLSGFYR